MQGTSQRYNRVLQIIKHIAAPTVLKTQLLKADFNYQPLNMVLRFQKE